MGLRWLSFLPLPAKCFQHTFLALVILPAASSSFSLGDCELMNGQTRNLHQLIEVLAELVSHLGCAIDSRRLNQSMSPPKHVQKAIQPSLSLGSFGQSLQISAPR
jgi:hypothetical protein